MTRRIRSQQEDLWSTARGGLDLEIARIRIRLRPSDHRMKIGVAPQYIPFLRHQASEAVDIDLTVHCQEIPPIAITSSLFQSEGVWALGKSEDRFVFSFTSSLLDPPLYKLALLSADFSRGDVFVRSDMGLVIDDSIYPLEFPLDELLITHWLAQGRGVELHACGLCLEGKGLVCCGPSGAGKTTMAQLWLTAGCGDVLSDDRIILRGDDGLCAYGTPWHGDAGVAVNRDCRLAAVFFLEHALDNRVHPLTPVEAASLLVARSFSPFWSRERLEATLEFIARVAETVPCYRLGFVPDQSIVGFLGSLL
jgi:hypothetical protein